MAKYILKRLVLSIFILFGVSVVIYGLVRAMPTDFVDKTFADIPNMTEERLAELKALYGLDLNLIEGYIKWVGDLLHGNLGTSFKYQQPVADVIKDKMWISFAISFVALVLELLVAIPLGVMAATKQYSKADYAVSVLALLGISLPGFFFAGILRKVFSTDLGWLPFNGLVSSRMLPGATSWTRFGDMVQHLILPITVLVITGMGSYMRFVRTNMLEVLNSDFVRTARAKGLQEKKIIYKHAFRNTLIPIVTLLGGTLPTLFAGAMITESVFGIPGLGGTAYEALSGSDIPFFMGFNMFLAVMTLAGNLLADILYAVVDPRIRVNK